MAPKLDTVKSKLSWSYANLARAHAALDEGAIQYTQQHHIIRARLYGGMMSGKLKMRSLYDDERLKMTLPQACVYCGAPSTLSLDHLLPRVRGGRDEADNLVWACRTCNSSKSGRDMLEWMSVKNRFPALFILRRYLKLGWSACDDNGALDWSLEDDRCSGLPLSLVLIPITFPPLPKLRLFMSPDTKK